VGAQLRPPHDSFLPVGHLSQLGWWTGSSPCEDQKPNSAVADLSKAMHFLTVRLHTKALSVTK
ncbi:unnamed protein product, partial [Bubo scandiacus]